MGQVLVLNPVSPGLVFVGPYISAKDTDFDTGQTLDLAATSGQTWCYYAIDHTDNIDLYAYDGTADKLVRSYTGTGLESVFLLVTDSERYRIKPGTGAADNAYLRAWGVRLS